MGNPNCCFMIILVTFFSPANCRGELCTLYYLARNLESYKSIIANFPSFNKTFDWKRYPKIAARSNFLKHETSKAYAKSSKSCCLGWSEKRSNLADYHQLSELSSRGVLGFTVISVLEFSA